MSWLSFLNPLSGLSPRRRWQVVYWTLHILIVLLIVIFLALLNHFGGLDKVLRTRFLYLNHIWLPLVFLVGYTLFWLIRWLYRLLGPEGAAGEFADIEKAWTSACEQLAEAGIDLREVPLFLVLGRSSSSIEHFFSAMRVPFQIRHLPPGDAAPLHIYASRQAIFVTSERASLLPMMLTRLVEEVTPPAPEPTLLDEVLGGVEAPKLDMPEELAALAQELEPMSRTEALTQAMEVNTGAVLLLGEPEPLSRTTKQSTPEAKTASAAATRRRTMILQELDTVDLQTRRLRHLCRLIVRDRRPYCPVNGILALIAQVGLETPEDASETAGVLRHDLEVARAALQQDCPRFVIGCDAEQLPGFEEMVLHFPEGPGAPAWVLGQHYSMQPDVPTERIPGLIDEGLAWTANTMLPLVIARLWRREGEEVAVGANRQAVLEANVRLYAFLGACRERLLNLARLASRGVQQEDGPPLLAGAYLAGTGPDARQQAFVAGIIRRAVEHQNRVRWTPEAFRDDQAYQRYAWLGYVLLLVLVMSLGLVLWSWW